MLHRSVLHPIKLTQKKLSSIAFTSPVAITSAFKARQFALQYSTFNAQQNSSNNQHKKTRKIPLWPRIKAFTSFTVSGILVVGATGISGIVIYLIGAELFSPSGDTQIFNRAVTKVENDETARKLLQCNDTASSKERLKAYGEILTDDKWTRNRPISSTKKIDKEGKEHYFMRFHVESKQKMGMVHIEAKESDVNYQPDFVSMYLDIPGEKRHYLIKPHLNIITRPKGFLGVNWGPKKN